MSRLITWARGQRTLWVIVAVVLVQSLFFYSTLADMVSLWTISVYRHCWIILPLCLYLIAERQSDVEAVAFGRNWLAVLALPALAIVLFVADRVSIRALEHTAFVLILIFSVLAVIGWRKFSTIIFPMVLLLAAIPVGDFMIPTLMDWTTDIAAALLATTGVPAWREGVLVTLPNGVFHVAEVCSGISYVLASFVLALVYSYLTFRSFKKRAAFVLFTLLCFVLLNGLRAFLVMVVANATEMRWFTGWDHVYFGQFLFVCLTIALYFLAQKFADKPSADGETGVATLSLPGSKLLMSSVLVIAASFGVHKISAAALSGDDGTRVMPESSLIVANCTGAVTTQAPMTPIVPGAAETMQSGFQCGQHRLYQFTAYFDDPGSGSEIVNRAHRFWPADWENIGRHGSYRSDVLPEDNEFAELSFTRSDKTRLVWYRYVIGSQVTASPYIAKLWEAVYGIRSATYVGSVQLVTVEAPGTLDDARQVLEQYVKTDQSP
ncbi:MAG: exosortase A [Woeseiaceae bacterium]